MFPLADSQLWASHIKALNHKEFLTSPYPMLLTSLANMTLACLGMDLKWINV